MMGSARDCVTVGRRETREWVSGQQVGKHASGFDLVRQRQLQCVRANGAFDWKGHTPSSTHSCASSNVGEWGRLFSAVDGECGNHAMPPTMPAGGEGPICEAAILSSEPLPPRREVQQAAESCCKIAVRFEALRHSRANGDIGKRRVHCEELAAGRG